MILSKFGLTDHSCNEYEIVVSWVHKMLYEIRRCTNVTKRCIITYQIQNLYVLLLDSA